MHTPSRTYTCSADLEIANAFYECHQKSSHVQRRSQETASEAGPHHTPHADATPVPARDMVHQRARRSIRIPRAKAPGGERLPRRPHARTEATPVITPGGERLPRRHAQLQCARTRLAHDARLDRSRPWLFITPSRQSGRARHRERHAVTSATRASRALQKHAATPAVDACRGIRTTDNRAL